MSTKTIEAKESTSNTTNLSQNASTLGRGSQLINGLRRSHRLESITDPAINPEMSTAGQAISGKTTPPTPAPKPTEVMQDNATSSSSKDAALVRNADGNEITDSQSSKGAQSWSMSSKL